MTRFIRLLDTVTVSLLLIGLSALDPTPARAITIDNFNNSTNEVNDVQVDANAVHKFSSTSNAIGGTRAYRAQLSSGESVRLSTSATRVYHEQNSASTGSTRLTWDGDSVPDNLDAAGLQGIDLLEDISNDSQKKFVIVDANIDSGLSNDAKITITVYDAGDPSGNTFSKLTKEFFSDMGGVDIEFPFADFTTHGPSGAASFENVGAITVDIDGASKAVDVDFDTLKTGGSCDRIPAKGGKVLDDCGVCGGNNQDKDDCGVCFGDNAAKDTCGVCFGENKDVDDCGVCFGENKGVDDCGVCGGNNSDKDACGVCGGNGSSCADCSGAPNGGAKIDVCKICGGDGKSCLDCNGIPFGPAAPDRCGVCGGDGSTCLECTSTSLDGLAEKLRSKSFQQQLHNLTFLDKVANTKPKLVKGLRKKIERAYRNLLTLVSELPVEVKSCSSVLCIDSEVNIQTVGNYQSNAKTLQRLAIKIFDAIAKLKGNGVCEGDIAQCIRRAKARKRELKYLKSFARRLLKENIALSNEIPLKTSICQ